MVCLPGYREVYLRHIYTFYKNILQYGSSLGDHMVETCLSNYIQESLDAYKKPEVKRKDNELKSILGPQLSPDEIEMVIFMKKAPALKQQDLLPKHD